jgi:hypothetical protein
MKNKKPVLRKPNTNLQNLFAVHYQKVKNKWYVSGEKHRSWHWNHKTVLLQVGRKDLSWKVDGKKVHFSITIDLEKFPFMKKRIKGLEKSRSAYPKKLQAARKKMSEWRRKNKMKVFE